MLSNCNLKKHVTKNKFQKFASWRNFLAKFCELQKVTNGNEPKPLVHAALMSTHVALMCTHGNKSFSQSSSIFMCKCRAAGVGQGVGRVAQFLDVHSLVFFLLILLPQTSL